MTNKFKKEAKPVITSVDEITNITDSMIIFDTMITVLSVTNLATWNGVTTEVYTATKEYSTP
jgi:hypothetical protein